jgi:hypothetical protein
MSNLKYNISEQAVMPNVNDSKLGTGTKIDGITTTDPYEYFIQFDKLSEPIKYFTRVKGKGNWIDLENKLSADKFSQAKSIIDSVLGDKSSYKQKVSDDDIKNQDDTAYKTVKYVINDLTEVLVNNPETYFKSFSSWVNDSEAEAAKWFKWAALKAHENNINWLKQNSYKTQAQTIISIINSFYTAIKTNKVQTFNGNIKVGSKSVPVNIKFDYFKY